MIALILAAVLSQSVPDSGTDAGTDGGIYSLCPDRVPVVPMDGGTFLPDQQGKRLNCMLDACDFRVAELEKVTVSPPPAWYYWIGGMVGAFATGVVVGIVYDKAHQQ